MVQCPACRVTYVANTLFCEECGMYLLEAEELGTDPLESGSAGWKGEGNGPLHNSGDLLDTGPLIIGLRINIRRSALENGPKERELEMPLVKPIRLGRMDPVHDIYPEIDLTSDRAMEAGVSREHACIFRRGNDVAVEDLASTNGTLLNGERLSPYLPERLKDGDQLQLGRLRILVRLEARRSQKTPAGNPAAWGLAA